ncbi:MAG TPA: zf-HC2 domain-containing protein [bacterium]
MNCKRYQKKLHLYRTGELSGRQVEKLERHIEQCPSCAAVRESIDRMETEVGRMRINIPRLKNPEKRCNRIMDAVSEMQKASLLPSVPRKEMILHGGGCGGSEGFRLKIFGRIRLSPLLDSPRARFGLAAAAALIVCAFFIQESLILSRISMLEKRMNAVSANRAASVSFRSVYPSAFEAINGIPGSARFPSAVREEWVKVRKTDLETLLKIVRRQYPEIETLDTSLFADPEIMMRILRKNPGIIRQILQSS